MSIFRKSTSRPSRYADNVCPSTTILRVSTSGMRPGRTLITSDPGPLRETKKSTDPFLSHRATLWRWTSARAFCSTLSLNTANVSGSGSNA